MDVACMAGCTEWIACLDGVPRQVLSHICKLTMLASFWFKTCHVPKTQYQSSEKPEI